MQRGIPAEQIAFIQEYDSDVQKHVLFKEVRSGKVRVLMGSTQKMGSGTNVQERLVALHHLDAPWRPADVEQREGRILRQGNLNQSVQIFRYVTEGSFDAYMWQTLETKAKFIHQVMTGDTHIRHIEDIDSRALTYAEVKAIASGNPLVIEKASVDAEITRLTRLRSQHGESQYRIRSQARHLKEQIPVYTQRIENLKLDMAVRKDTRGDAFEIEIAKTTYKDRAIAGELINRAAHRAAGGTEEQVIGFFAGFQLCARPTFLQRVEITLKGKNFYICQCRRKPPWARFAPWNTPRRTWRKNCNSGNGIWLRRKRTAVNWKPKSASLLSTSPSCSPSCCASRNWRMRSTLPRTRHPTPSPPRNPMSLRTPPPRLLTPPPTSTLRKPGENLSL